jgi:Xaa-Pro aminopeptidase
MSRLHPKSQANISRRGTSKDVPRLLVAASEASADILYATRFFAPDPFIYVRVKNRTFGIFSDLEVDRARAEAQVDEVLSMSSLSRPLAEKLRREPTPAELIHAFLASKRVRKVAVNGEFPFSLGRALEDLGLRLTAIDGLFWPEREYKSAEELRAIGRALRITEAGIARAFEVLRTSRIGRGHRLYWARKTLTSEILRFEIDAAVLRAGGTPANTIVAGGSQACDPHERGHGPLRAHEMIIIDVFPRDMRSGYYGDLTRTVVKGRPTEAARRMWHAVREGQQRALRGIKPGVHGGKIHDQVKAFFTEKGFPTEIRNGRWTGFFHGTGHGLGLDLHETPRFARTTFKPGQVLTVEPGLYDPAIGGARIEDVITVTATGCRKLSRIETPFEV